MLLRMARTQRATLLLAGSHQTISTTTRTLSRCSTIRSSPYHFGQNRISTVRKSTVSERRIYSPPIFHPGKMVPSRDTRSFSASPAYSGSHGCLPLRSSSPWRMDEAVEECATSVLRGLGERGLTSARCR